MRIFIHAPFKIKKKQGQVRPYINNDTEHNKVEVASHNYFILNDWTSAKTVRYTHIAAPCDHRARTHTHIDTPRQRSWSVLCAVSCFFENIASTPRSTHQNRIVRGQNKVASLFYIGDYTEKLGRGTQKCGRSSKTRQSSDNVFSTTPNQ